MAKAVFRPGEAKELEKKMVLPLFKDYTPVEEEPEVEEEVYDGPTVEDLKKEAEEFKAQWEQEKLQMQNEAQLQADAIIKKAEDAAFEEVQRQTNSAAEIKANAENEANQILSKARAEAEQIVAEAEAKREQLESAAHQNGYEAGYKEGYDSGVAEVNRLVERMHKMVESVMQRREEILSETESQIVELVILMARKVIKILSESQKNVVMANTLAALKKVKARGKVTLRVNLEEVKLTSAHIQEFIQHVENIEAIKVLEDSSVEKGGCIVETDFGAIDARISSQLTELENKILEVSPLKTIKPQDNLTSAE
ncbi:Flagellar biosynthesis/type III secretory pathway protein [Treponema sp. JC4]|uniref:flagellar assembly protein FliH n=1 Tax=Treponema sp. JC4 TaxID=1124982 RepID=UPI00025AFC1A|nr:flagellar assembly protein FliH [Treponema sp. JC4]EID84880.1 Flagellar biosynthesis/type III secretory pathway protein [Treponema sp. JC4]